MNISLLMGIALFSTQLGFHFDSNSFSEEITNTEINIYAAKKKKKFKKTAGSYIGTFVISKVKSFNGASCNPTDSFPGLAVVTQSKKKVTVALNNVPFPFTGKANKKGFRTKGNTTSGNVKRNYVLTARKVKQASATLKLNETVRIGGVKGCVFTHTMANAGRS